MKKYNKLIKALTPYRDVRISVRGICIDDKDCFEDGTYATHDLYVDLSGSQYRGDTSIYIHLEIQAMEIETYGQMTVADFVNEIEYFGDMVLRVVTITDDDLKSKIIYKRKS